MRVSWHSNTDEMNAQGRCIWLDLEDLEGSDFAKTCLVDSDLLVVQLNFPLSSG